MYSDMRRKTSIDNWWIVDGKEVDDFFIEFAACILSFLNEGAIEVTSSLNDETFSVQLLDIHGNNNFLCSRISVIYICIHYRNIMKEHFCNKLQYKDYRENKKKRSRQA